MSYLNVVRKKIICVSVNVVVANLFVPLLLPPAAAEPAVEKKVSAESVADTRPEIPVTTQMSPVEFENWVKKAAYKRQPSKETPLLLEYAVIERLRSGKVVTEKTIFAAIAAWHQFEQDSKSESPTKINDSKELYPEGKRFTEKLLSLTGETNLQARLHEQKAYFYRTEGDTKNEIDEYSKALNLLTQLQVDIDRRKVETTFHLAQRLKSVGETTKADELYIKVISYPWWSVEEPHISSILFGYYVQAGRALINIRRNDLAALKTLRFVPSAKDLPESLKRAIERAEIEQKLEAVKRDNTKTQ